MTRYRKQKKNNIWLLRARLRLRRCPPLPSTSSPPLLSRQQHPRGSLAPRQSYSIHIWEDQNKSFPSVPGGGRNPRLKIKSVLGSLRKKKKKNGVRKGACDSLLLILFTLRRGMKGVNISSPPLLWVSSACKDEEQRVSRHSGQDYHHLARHHHHSLRVSEGTSGPNGTLQVLNATHNQCTPPPHRSYCEPMAGQNEAR
ncbi:hypothetical protein E2C01_095932 [Portunus trituberculatus]|uniref:Uncharacterized protein n=1 Tax=Portunus trituberculatus TaxID=210409 RepID=A0A5B7K5K2_PORTR|nr:hypothetical protein [Portunus trituberculatus]